MSIATGNLQPSSPCAADPFPGEAKSNPRMENAAHQFEASLMQELFAPFQQDALFAGDDEQRGGSSSGALTGFASEAMARAVSDRGGFGIARQLIRHFEQLDGHDEKMGAQPRI